MKKYDISVYFAANYLCTGSFYDSFEYWWLLKQRYRDVGFIIMAPPEVRKETIYRAICDKYDVSQFGDSLLEDGDVHIFNREDYKNKNKIVPVISDLLFIPSGSSAGWMYYNNILISKKKVITIWELPNDHLYMRGFDIPRPDVLMLYDPRVFGESSSCLNPRDDYPHRHYFRAIYFDIMRKQVTVSRESCLLNMVTDHKCYEPNDLIGIMNQYQNIKHWTIVTKDKWWKKYKVMADTNIEVLLSPVDDYMNKFDTLLYLPSLRELDPSPRLLPEAKYFGKEVIYHDFDNAPKDGGYWRYFDMLLNWNDLFLDQDDPIFEIIEDWC